MEYRLDYGKAKLTTDLDPSPAPGGDRRASGRRRRVAIQRQVRRLQLLLPRLARQREAALVPQHAGYAQPVEDAAERLAVGPVHEARRPS